MKIAIFGGSFDPVHIGHENIVKIALDKLEIDKLIIIPTFLNPFKKKFFLEPSVRFELLKKVFDKYDKVDVCDYEIKQNKTTYSIQTVKYLHQLYKPEKLFFIIGEDNLKSLHRWNDIEELQTLVEFIVAKRETHKNESINNFKTLELDMKISSTSLRENMDLNYIPQEIQEDIKNLKKGRFLNKRLEDIKAILDDKKAVDIEVIDLTSKEYIVDYVVIATTLNPKHGFALLNYLKTELKPKGEEFLRIDEDDNWTIIDLGDIFVHLMSESHREKYSLEEFLEELESKK